MPIRLSDIPTAPAATAAMRLSDVPNNKPVRLSDVPENPLVKTGKELLKPFSGQIPFKKELSGVAKTLELDKALQDESAALPTGRDMIKAFSGAAKRMPSIIAPAAAPLLNKLVTPEEGEAAAKVMGYPMRQMARPAEALRAGVGAMVDKKPTADVVTAAAKGFLRPDQVKTLTERIPFQEWEQGSWGRLIPRALLQGTEDFAVYGLTYGKPILKAKQAIKGAATQDYTKAAQELVPKFEKAGVSFPEGWEEADKAMSIIRAARTNPDIGDLLNAAYKKVSQRGGLKPGEIAKAGDQAGQISGGNAAADLAGKVASAALGELGKSLTPGVNEIVPLQAPNPTETPQKTEDLSILKTPTKEDISGGQDQALIEEADGNEYADDALVEKARAESRKIPETININTPERLALRDDIIKKEYGTGAKLKNKEADIVIGLPASGKNTYVVEPLSEANGAIVIDSDIYKEKLPEYNKGIGASAVHKESSNIIEKEIMKQAIMAGDNIVLPCLGKNISTMRGIISELKQSGYTVRLHHVSLPAEKAALRAINRFKQTGRFVDPQYIRDLGLLPKNNYDILKLEKEVSDYAEWSTDVEHGKEAILTESTKPIGLRSRRSRRAVIDSGNPGSPTGAEGSQEVIRESDLFNQGKSDEEKIAKPEQNISNTVGDVKITTPEGGFLLQKSAFALQFKNNGYLFFPNQKVTHPADLAFAFQHLKNEAVENFYIGAMKSGRVVSVELITTGTYNKAAPAIYELFNLLDKSNADTVFFVHNHPSGIIKYSKEDMDFTQNAVKILEKSGFKFGGHVIIDTEKFGFIDKGFNYTDFAHQEYAKTKKIPALKKYIEWAKDKSGTGPAIHSSEEAFELAKGIQIDNDSCLACALDNQNRVINMILMPRGSVTVGNLQKSLTRLRAGGVILINSPFDPKQLTAISDELANAGIKFLDDILVKFTGNIPSDYGSHRAEGLFEPGEKYHGLVRDPGADDTSFDFGENVENIESITPEELKQMDAEMKIVEHESRESLFKTIKQLGGIASYKGGFMKEELVKVPPYLRGKIAADEMVTLLRNEGFFFDDDNDLLNAIENEKAVERDYREAKQYLTDVARRLRKQTKANERVVNALDKFLSKRISVSKVKPVIERSTGVKRLSDIISMREDTALKGQLRAEVKGSREGYRAARISILKDLREKQLSIAGVKSKIVEYAKQNLPMSERGRLLNMVANAKTQEQLTKAFFRIDGYAEQYQKRALIKAARKKINSIIDSPTVAVEYRQKVKELLDQFEFGNKREATLEKYKQIQDYIKKESAAGKEVYMPERILEQLAALTKKPISSLTVKELEVLNDQIDLMEQLGKTKLRARKALYEAEKNRLKSELISGTANLDRYKEIMPDVGERLAFGEWLRNAITGGLKGAQKIDLAISPMDVVFDVLDFSKGTYNGANYRIFKAPTDVNFCRFLDLKNETQKPLQDLSNRLGLDDKNFERIGIHAARVQKNGMDKLLNSGLTEQEINAIQLTDTEMEWYEAARAALDELRPKIAQIMQDVFNQELGFVEDYFSFMTDWQAMDEAEVFQRVGNMAEEYGLPTKNPNMDFAKKRVGAGRQKIKLNAYDIFMRHTDNATYLITMSRTNRMLFEIANSPDYKEAAGSRGQRIVLEWLDTISRKGGAAGQKQIQILDVLRKNIGVGVLGFKVSTILIQPTALLDAGAYIGNYALRGAFSICDQEWRNLVMKFPEFRERVGDDPAFLAYVQGHSLFDKIQQFGMSGIMITDKLTTMATCAGAYEKKMAELGLPIDFNNVNKEAMIYAQFVMRRTQSTGIFKDVPQAISRGGLTNNRSLDRILMQFQNFLLNRWSMIRHDIWRSGVKQKDPKKAAGMLFWLVLATLATTGIRLGQRKVKDWIAGKEEDPDEDRFYKTFTQEAIQGVPFIGQMVSSITYGSLPVPVIEAASSGIEGAKNVFAGKSNSTKLKGGIEAVEAGAKFVGIPGATEASGLARSMINGPDKFSGRAKSDSKFSNALKSRFSKEEVSRFSGKKSRFSDL